MPWTVLALGLFAVVALLSPIPEFVATALDGSPGLWALVFPPATVVYAAYRDVRRRSVFSPVLAEFVDAALFMVIYFASVYSLLAPAGAFAPNTFAPNKGLGPFDLFYFSVVTFSTTGFGDITPASTTARVLVTGQILIGSFFVIAVLGLLVSRLSAKTLRGRSGRR
jgi:hypothetical protein